MPSFLVAVGGVLFLDGLLISIIEGDSVFGDYFSINNYLTEEEDGRFLVTEFAGSLAVAIFLVRIDYYNVVGFIGCSTCTCL